MKNLPACLALVLAAALTSACLDKKCFGDADCQSPQRCGADGLCAFECVDESGCSQGFVCREHRCEPAPVGPITCPAEMAAIADSFCIDRYEASRADATALGEGSDDSIARSVSGVLPWRVTSNSDALAACQAAGKRLCSPEEWRLACRGAGDSTYAYGDAYEPATCNGIDAFGRSDFHLEPTGAFPGCTNGWGVFDLNGNLWEHVAGGSDLTVRGGAYNCGDSAKLHKCDYIPGNWAPSARGFRCCLTPAAVADAGMPAPDAGTPTADAGTGSPDAGAADGGGCVEDDAGLLPVDAGSQAEDAGAEVDAGTPPDAGADDAGADDAGTDDGGCRQEMAQVGSYCIDRWEASHEDATTTSQGTALVPRSRPGVMPWWPVSTAEARAACGLAGKRLCRVDEWVGSCSGPSGAAYSYGDAYGATTCNGIDAFCRCGSATCGEDLPECPYPHCYNRAPDGGMGGCGSDFHVAPTGSFMDCVNGEGVFDLNGNVWEVVDHGPDAGTVDYVRGGAYNCSDSEALHRCDYEATWSPPVRGFRCCADLP